MKSEDALLIADALEGSEKAYSSLMTKYRERVFSFIRMKGYDYATSDDITQDTFIDAFRGLKTFKTDMNFLTWICAIAKKKMSNVNKDRKREKELVGKDVPRETPSVFLEEGHDIVSLLKPLPIKQQYALYYKYVHEMTYGDIAETLGCSIHAAMALVKRGKATLRSKDDKQ